MADREPPGVSFERILLDESPDTLIALTVGGRIASWNRGARAMFGYTAEEAIGRSYEDLTVPEEGRANARRALAEVLTRGSAVMEVVRRRKDGSLIHVDVIMRRVDRPDLDTFIAVSKKDITPLK